MSDVTLDARGRINWSVELPRVRAYMEQHGADPATACAALNLPVNRYYGAVSTENAKGKTKKKPGRPPKAKSSLMLFPDEAPTKPVSMALPSQPPPAAPKNLLQGKSIIVITDTRDLAQAFAAALGVGVPQ